MADEDEIQTSEPESLHDTISKAMDEVAAKDEKKIVPEVEVSTTFDASQETKESRARGQDGKFVKKEAAPEAAVAEAPKALTAPQSWPAAAKAKWANIPADIQQDILAREEEVHRGITKQDDERNLGKQMKEVITPYMHIITAEGGNPASAVKELLNTAYQLRVGTPQQKGQLLLQVAHQFGADLSQASQARQGDPAVQQLQNEIAQLRGYLSSQEMTKQQQEQASIQGEVDAFAADSKNVHFETVKADMAALLGAGRAKNLQEAYDMAVWARPDIRSTLLQQSVADEEAKRTAAKAAKTDAARKAGGSVKGAPGAAIPVNGAGARSLREELERNFASLS